MDKEMNKEMNKEIELLLKNILELSDLSTVRLEKIKKCKYLIILDMGCGSTSAAILDLESYYKDKGRELKNYIVPILWWYRQYSVKSSEEVYAENQVSIPTLIGYSNLKPVVGPAALYTGNAIENFKACPSEQSLNKDVLQIETYDGEFHRRLKDVWSDYFDCILEMLCYGCYKQQIGISDRISMRDNTLIMVAHPAGAAWSQNTILNNYRKIISEGTKLPDENILTISEAKAAMQYVRRKYGKILDFDKGVVIIDIGASTIDIEYLAKDLSDPYECSLTLAGRDVDSLLLHYALENLFPEQMKDFKPNQLPDESFFMEQLSSRGAELMYDARGCKEMVSDLARTNFSEDTGDMLEINNVHVTINANILCGILGDRTNDPLTGAVFGKRSFPVSYPMEVADYIYKMRTQTGTVQPGGCVMQEVEDTWYGHLENLVRYVMDELSDGVLGKREVAQVIVTGGSCQLVGIEPHIWKAVQDSKMGTVLRKEEQIIYMDGEYDYENAVPFGGGYYVGGVLGQLEKLQNFPEELAAILSPELKKVSASAITKEVNALVRDITIDTLEWWKDLGEGDRNSTTNALNIRLKSNCGQVLKQNDKLKSAITKAIKTINPEADLQYTMDAIYKLLNALAGTKFTGKVNAGVVQVNLPVYKVVNAVQGVNPACLDIDFWQTIKGKLQELGNAIRNLFGAGVAKDNIKRHQAYRNAVYEAYKQSNDQAVNTQLEQEIASKLAKEFAETGIFGIPDQIISGLRQDIMRALYLN